MVRNYMVILFTTFGVVAAGGCHHAPPNAAPAKPMTLPVSEPVRREVTDYVDFTGRTDAVESVGIRARVTGYLVKMPFEEGAEVKQGDVLFEIDPRPYQAQLDQAQSQVALNEASLNVARVNYERNLPLVSKGAVSPQELDQYKATVDEAAARIKASKSALEVYKLNLGFTKVTAPIDGQVSRYFFTRGNLVNQDQTLLTTVVSLDPMYAYFDMDEPTLLRVKRAINDGRIKLYSKGASVRILMGLQGEEGFPHQGKFNFLNNVVNPSTGTVAVRGVFPNPRPAAGARMLAPGMFVRIRLPIGQPHPALLVIDRAVGSDQGLKFVYVLDKDNKVQYRRVSTGPLQDYGLRVIEDGLQEDDRVVTGGLQQVRPGMDVSPDETPMPTVGTQGEAPPPVSDRPQPPRPGKKRQIRISKSEGNPNDQIQMTQTGMVAFRSLRFRVSDLFRISRFGFRI